MVLKAAGRTEEEVKPKDTARSEWKRTLGQINAVWSLTALRPVHLNETQDDLHTHSGSNISGTLILKWNCFSLENTAFISESTA